MFTSFCLTPPASSNDSARLILPVLGSSSLFCCLEAHPFHCSFQTLMEPSTSREESLLAGTPVLFHPFHGENIELLEHRRRALRRVSFEKVSNVMERLYWMPDAIISITFRALCSPNVHCSKESVFSCQ